MRRCTKETKMGRDQVKVSIIIPTYNRQDVLVRCIESVQRQTLKEIEIICIDDGSTDNTRTTIQNLINKDNRIHYYYQRNQGAGMARNKGIRKSRGQYIAFLDSDDQYHDKKSLQKLYQLGKERVADVCAGMLVSNINGRLSVDFTKDIETINERFVPFTEHQNVLGFTSFFYRREFLVDNNIFFPKYRYSEDPLFLMDVLISAGGYWFKPIVFYEILGHERFGYMSDMQIREALMATYKMLKVASQRGFPLLYKRLIDTLNRDYYDGIMHNLNQDNLQLLVQIMRFNSGSKYCRKIELLEDIQVAASTYADDHGSRTLPGNIKWELAFIQKNIPMLENYFVERNISRVVLYGLGKYGSAFYNLINNTKVEIVAFVDKLKRKFMGYQTIRPEDDFPLHDTIVIAMQYAEGAFKMMEEKGEDRIILFSEIIDSLCEGKNE